jgi:hypothetical protein
MRVLRFLFGRGQGGEGRGKGGGGVRGGGEADKNDMFFLEIYCTESIYNMFKDKLLNCFPNQSK